MGYINRDGIGPYRIEVLRRIERGEIKRPADCGKPNPLPLLIQKNLVHWRGGRYQLTLDGRVLLEEVAEDAGEARERPPLVRDIWCDRIKEALPILPERFKSDDVRLALNEEWTQTTMCYIATFLRYLEQRGVVRAVRRDGGSLIWEKC